ncbi:MAG: 50S ribosomal protein L10 [bacterium]
MNRQQKEVVVSDFKDLFSDSRGAFLVSYKGMTVSQMQDLRRTLREVDGLVKVTKARLMRLAVQDVEGVDGLKDFFHDQIALVFAKNEVQPTAKKLVEFAGNGIPLEIVSGFFESKVLSKKEINLLASLPSREVLLSQLVGTLQAPMSGLARLLNMMILRLLYGLKEVAAKKQ